VLTWLNCPTTGGQFSWGGLFYFEVLRVF
jgi:hypothetical protein